MSITTLAQAIPQKYRKIIYSVLATIVTLEAIFDVIPYGWESKIMAALVVLGFGVAIPNTKSPDGSISIETTEDGKKMFSLELPCEPEDLELMNEISFKVKR